MFINCLVKERAPLVELLEIGSQIFGTAQVNVCMLMYRKIKFYFIPFFFLLKTERVHRGLLFYLVNGLGLVW